MNLKGSASRNSMPSPRYFVVEVSGRTRCSADAKAESSWHTAAYPHKGLPAACQQKKSTPHAWDSQRVAP